MLDLADLLPCLYWLALGGAGATAVWWQARARAPHRFARDRATYRHARRRAQLRSYRVQADAERRAETLLREVIGDRGFVQMLKRGYLEVRSPTFPSRSYLVPERQGPVTVCEHGRPIMRLCVQTVERVPDYDTVVMHKLMIEGNEREYLRIANRV
jgi:hypothetical protein